MTSGIEVYKSINAVQAALARRGISKDRKAQAGASYAFRGIDDIYGALASLLDEHGLVILPKMESRTTTERTNKNGTVMFYTLVHAVFTFVSSRDGSTCTASTFGEAMDTSDKSTNKAMSAAYKYMALQTFCIPIEGQDTETEHHEVAPEFSHSDDMMLDAIAKCQTIDDLTEWSKLHGGAAAQSDNAAHIRAAYRARMTDLNSPKIKGIMYLTPETG